MKIHIGALFCVGLVAGCGSPFPGTLSLPLPCSDGDTSVNSGQSASAGPEICQTIEAGIGTGPARLASSIWALYDPSLSPPHLIARAEFGSDGAIIRIFDNQDFAPETIGPELVIDGNLHASQFPFLTYRAASYGAEEGQAITFAGLAQSYLGPTLATTPTIYFYGQLDPDGNKATGLLRVAIGASIPLPGISDYSVEGAVIALREQ